MVHALSVMTLSLLLAKQLALDEATLRAIGIAALLHDIGKSSINPSILRNPARNRFEEAIYQSHGKLGAEELRRLGVAVPPAVFEVMLHHHERRDGKGFPGLGPPAELGMPARIVAITNRFDNLANPVDPKTALSPFEALGLMWSREQGAIDDRSWSTIRARRGARR